MSIVTEAHTDDVPEGMHVMVTLDQTGDTKLIWNPDDPIEVENARATFDRLVKEKKMAAYAVRKNGEKGEVVRTFDPTVEKLIFAPRMVGG
jgi:hypothetical protein